MTDFSAKQRRELKKTGEAMPDGSFPIRNKSDLSNAIQAVGRANPEKRGKVRRHIIRRARALGASGMIPDSWSMDGKSSDDK